jgi:hypothetical protein
VRHSHEAATLMTPMTEFSDSRGFWAARLTHLYASRTGGNNADSVLFHKNFRLAISLWRYPSGRLPPG